MYQQEGALASPSHEKLPRREREVLDAVFAIGDGASVEDVRGRLTDPPSYSAVRAMLARLEAKGHVRHREEGLRYVYAPTKPRGVTQRTALQKVVRVFFGGSPSEAVTALLKQEEWSDEELEALTAEIKRARVGGRRS
ncbi:MAG: BlaI/MecI/CopY family transcriptional regulator [Gemmatimonadaceae bacterium]